MEEEVKTLKKQSEKKDEKKPSDPFAPEKIIGVGFIGALSGILLYYLYYQLSDDMRSNVKHAVVYNIKRQVAQMVSEE